MKEQALLKGKYGYKQTRLNAYKRYINTIKPINDLLHSLDDEKPEDPKEYIKQLKEGKKDE